MEEVRCSDFEQMFKLIGDKSIRVNYPGSDRQPQFVTVEDLYQLFRARLMAELYAAGNGDLLDRPTSPDAKSRTG